MITIQKAEQILGLRNAFEIARGRFQCSLELKNITSATIYFKNNGDDYTFQLSEKHLLARIATLITNEYRNQMADVIRQLKSLEVNTVDLENSIAAIARASEKATNE